MVPCPSCGAALKFSIDDQKLKCDYCGSLTNVGQAASETFAAENSAEEKEFFETTVFYCPQCGGEMMGDDTDATAFCSYCGAPNVLETRLVKEKRPAKIIPFKVNKAACIETFNKAMQKNFFVPKALKKEGIVDSFRGIYTPYYNYRFVQQKHLDFTSETSVRSGSYVTTSTYRNEADLDNTFEELTHDASTSFYDDISEAMGPYDTRELKPFDPEYLAGFYADIPDVDEKLYREEMAGVANDQTLAQVQSSCQGVITGGINRRDLSESFGTTLDKVETRMYPTWFMSYRYKDKIAYATVNGQTGKLVTDFPIDTGKVIRLSLIIALGIFIMLNIFFTLKPPVTLTIASYVSMISLWIMRYQSGRIFAKMNFTEDRAMQKLLTGKEETGRRRKTFAEAVSSFNKKSSPGLGMSISMLTGFMIVTMLAGGGFFAVFVCSVVTGIVCIKGTAKAHDFKAMAFCIILTAILQITSFLLAANPPQDTVYYVFAMIQLVLLIFSVLHIIGGLNDMALRPLPQFKKKGGDDGVR